MIDAIRWRRFYRRRKVKATEELNLHAEIQDWKRYITCVDFRWTMSQYLNVSVSFSTASATASPNTNTVMYAPSFNYPCGCKNETVKFVHICSWIQGCHVLQTLVNVILTYVMFLMTMIQGTSQVLQRLELSTRFDIVVQLSKHLCHIVSWIPKWCASNDGFTTVRMWFLDSLLNVKQGSSLVVSCL